MTTVFDEPDDAPRGEPSLEGYMRMLGQSGLGGWDALDQRKNREVFAEVQRLRNAEIQRAGNLLRDVLWLDPRGREVLEFFLDMTLRRRTWPNPLLLKGRAFEREGIYREAENSFVAMILEAISRAQGVEPTGRSET